MDPTRVVVDVSVDRKDAPFVTLTLHLDGRLWSDDAELKTGLLARGFDRFFTP